MTYLRTWVRGHLGTGQEARSSPPTEYTPYAIEYHRDLDSGSPLASPGTRALLAVEDSINPTTHPTRININIFALHFQRRVS